MDKKASEALEASIATYERRQVGEFIPYGSRRCALCHEFLEHGCVRCPVSAKTHGNCYRDPSPYIKIENHIIDCQKYKSGKYCPTCLELNQKELDFLKSLRE